MVSFSRAASCASHFPRLKSSTTLETSCFGVCRSDTFSFLERRSRSRCRIRSRSLATAFMRLASPSPANSGIINVYAVALTAMAASTMETNRASWIFSIRKLNMLPPSEVEVDHSLHYENADGHPDRAAKQHQLTGWMGPQQRNVIGGREVDEQHDDRRQRTDNARGRLGFHRHRLNLLGHLLAIAQHLGQVAQGLRQVAAGLLLDCDHDPEEIRLRQRHPFEQPRAGIAERHADRLGFYDGEKLALQRLWRIGGDDLDRLKQRQARLDAAYDHVDGVRQCLEKVLFPAFLEKAQAPARQPEARGEREA